MVTIRTNCEFASELICVIPYAYWLHQNNKLDEQFKGFVDDNN